MFAMGFERSRKPGFSLVAIATLALGIGANTAMFSLLDQVVLRLLPVSDPERLVIVRRDRQPLRQQLRPQHHFLADVRRFAR
jgi:hypothetical protein